MQQLLEDFYQSLGLAYLPTDESPVLVVDETLACYFIEGDGGWRLMAPLGPLTTDAPMLEALLCANFEEGNRVTMAASRAAGCLLAWIDVNANEGLQGMDSAFRALVEQAREWRAALEQEQVPQA